MASVCIDRASLAERTIYLEGHPFSLVDYPMMRTVYNDNSIRLLMLCGRQIGKSTSVCNFLLTEMMAIPQFRTLFIAPSKEQTSRFSNTRFAKAMHFSPVVERYFINNKMPSNNVMLRMLANGSEITFSYAVDDADRVRGVSADRLCLDEAQNIILSEVEPVLRECLAASKYKNRMYTGTPLSVENDIEILWQKSTMCEWIVTCKFCAKYNIVTEKNLGDKYLMCNHCGKELDVRNGKWYAQNPKADVAGYHISQLVVPANVSTIPSAITKVRPYDLILEKRRDYSTSKFNNEVLGISDSVGTRLVSLDQLKSLCKDYAWSDLDHNNQNIWKDVTQTVAGVDYSGQGLSNVSRTVLLILGILPNHKLRLMYGKIFPHGNPVADVEEIAKMCDIYRCQIVIGDAGEGAMANATLRKKLGHHRVFSNRYAGGTSGATGAQKMIRWNKLDGYMSDRTAMVDQAMNLFINQGIEFPTYGQMEPYIKDIMNEYEESTPHGRRVWRHSSTLPDDSLHALIYGWLASRVVTGTVKMYE